ncbi:MAG: single-stranded DNA-binding protein [Candidatus Campbellbacteria bacterium]|nr:single-stranded DNA-binding protein [Candidatus Campbellbacteria bacterium]
MYINKAIIYGNLTQDPELKTLPNGNNVLNTSVATNRVWKNQEGQKQESVEYHNIVAFGRVAEIIAQYLKKGSGIFVEGRLQTRNWEADGVKKYRTEIIVENMQLGPRRSGQPGDTSSGEGASSPSGKNAINYPNNEINPNDIPF